MILDQIHFLNETNNACTDLCEPWNVDVFQVLIYTDTGIPTYVEVEYTSCNNNQLAKKVLYQR